MRIFVYEYLSSGGHGEGPGGSALLTEGWAMLAAAVQDFARCTDVEPVTLLDPRLLPVAAARWPKKVEIHTADSARDGPDFRRLAGAAEWTLVIAPEYEGILGRHCHWVEEAGGRLLGPSARAVALTADKLELAGWLRKGQGIATPPALPFSAALQAPWPFPWVCKPRDGAGSQATFLVSRPSELMQCREQARKEGWPGELIVQPYVAGQPASVAYLVGPECIVALPAAQQQLSQDGRFHYEGGSLPLPRPLCTRALQLASRAVRAVPGLLGFVGVDLVLGGADDGSADAVIEINPRLTTSYVGLRRWARFNLAEAVLAVVQGEPVPELLWRQGTLRFAPDGEILE
jgi:predicted ATP-grasp superfamily ATP-dependent carboligase